MAAEPVGTSTWSVNVSSGKRVMRVVIPQGINEEARDRNGLEVRLRLADALGGALSAVAFGMWGMLPKPAVRESRSWREGGCLYAKWVVCARSGYLAY